REYGPALADVGAVLLLDPGCAEAYSLRAGLRERTGASRAEQLADLDRALGQDHYDRPALDHKARVRAPGQKARIREQTPGRPREALAVLNKLFVHTPDSVPLLVRRAYLLARLGECVTVHGDVEDFLKREPTPARRYQAACILALNSRLLPT